MGTSLETKKEDVDLHGGGIRGAERDIVSLMVHKWVRDMLKESLGDAAVSSFFFFFCRFTPVFNATAF